MTGVGLQRATDRNVWQYARDHDFVLVSKDSDFNDLAFIHGPPPKVIWLRVGNASTDDIEALLAAATDDITALAVDQHDAVLVLRPTPTPADNDAR